MFFNLLAVLGALISLWGTAKYMVEIGRGRTQPRLASWIAWGTANLVLMAVGFLNGNVLAGVFNGVGALGNISVLLLSAVKRAGERPAGTTDWTCLVTSGLCLSAIVAFPHMWQLDACLAMTANVVATWPTIQHAWHRPREEAWQLFAANSGANALGLTGVIASGGMVLCNIAGPLISMLGNLALVMITVGRNWLTRVTEEVQEEITEVEETVAAEVQSLTQEVAGKVGALANPASVIADVVLTAPVAARPRPGSRQRARPSAAPLGSTASG
jgi:hypothetical protein